MATVEEVELFLYWGAATFFISSLSSMVVERRQTRKMWDRYVKPSFAPGAPWVFGAVWFVLYLLQAIAATRIRLLGAFVSGVNQFELILYLVLQVTLATYTPLMFGFGQKTWSNLSTFVALILAGILAYNVYDMGDHYSFAIFLVLMAWLVYALALGIGIQVLNDVRKTLRKSNARRV